MLSILVRVMHEACNHGSAHSSLHQTLDELSFERGIWQACLDGDLGRVEQLIQKNRSSVDEPDSSGYYALVSAFPKIFYWLQSCLSSSARDWNPRSGGKSSSVEDSICLSDILHCHHLTHDFILALVALRFAVRSPWNLSASIIIRRRRQRKTEVRRHGSTPSQLLRQTQGCGAACHPRCAAHSRCVWDDTTSQGTTLTSDR